MRRIAIVILIGSAAHAQTPFPPHWQEKERGLSDEVVRDARVEAHKGQCIVAIGNGPLCKCIAEQIPTTIDFMSYVGLVQPMEALTYHTLLDSQKRLIDVARAAHDKCISQAGSSNGK